MLQVLPMLWLALLGMKCATSRSGMEPDARFPGEVSFWNDSEKPSHTPRLLWKKRAEGAITDLALAPAANRVLVATQPDADIPGSFPKTAVSLWDFQGRRLWRVPLNMGTKGVAIAPDAAWVVASNYSDEILAWNARGAKKWESLGTCRPSILRARQELLCYHDDDAEPFLAFEGFAAKDGSKKYQIPIQRDILALKISAQQRWIAIALAGGGVRVYELSDAGPVQKWQSEATGEVSDLDISNSGEVAAIVAQSRVQFWSSEGKRQFDWALPARATQIGLTPDASRIAVYGNALGGQRLAVFSRKPDASGFVLSWARGTDFPAEYHSQLQVFGDHLVLGVENLENGSRSPHLMAWSWDGRLLWNIEPHTEVEGAYLYTRAYSGDGKFVVLGSDDGWMHAYKINP